MTSQDLEARLEERLHPDAADQPSVIDEHLGAGRSAVYFDDDLDDYVQEAPDGRRHRVRLRRGAVPEILEEVRCRV